MSHRMVMDAMRATVEGRPVINNYPALRLACRRRGLLAADAELPLVEDARVGEESTHRGVRTRGYEVQLRGWHKKSYFDTDSGSVFYDNWNGNWGDIRELRGLESAYAAATVDIARETIEQTAALNGDQFRVVSENEEELVLEICN